MLYTYMTIESDQTIVSHSQIIVENNVEKVIINFERPNRTGDFDNARCELPSYTWLYNEGYSKEELSFFTELVEHNAHLFYKYAKCGGLKIA